ncbi:MAG: hypothetical protein MUF70_06065 [Myxococcota bacterium]|jgi:hypothetical protein|nr:hypothetical protein [Myxococcota bacterium]
MSRPTLRRVTEILGVAASLVGLATPCQAQSCSWVSSVSEWHGSLSWSWNHSAAWSDSEGWAYTTQTTDAATSTFDLDANGFGYAAGELLYDEMYTTTSPPPNSNRGFTHYELGWPAFPTPVMDLHVNPFDCTYTWDEVVTASGTVTDESGSSPVAAKPPNMIVLPLEGYPIPSLPGPLSFSGPMPVRIVGTGTPFPLFVTGSGSALESSVELGQEQLGDAQVSWTFQPGQLTAPLNDSCANAKLLLGAALQDTTAATSAVTDPVSSCGTGDRSTWFRYVPLFAGAAQISTAGSGYGTVVSVWEEQEGCAALTTEVGCGASIPMEAQKTYLIQVQRASGSAGDLEIAIVPEPGAPLEAVVAGLVLAVGRRSSIDRRRRK